jgi:hypothetical protein
MKALIRPGRGRRGPAAEWLVVAGAERATQTASAVVQPIRVIAPMPVTTARSIT